MNANYSDSLYQKTLKNRVLLVWTLLLCTLVSYALVVGYYHLYPNVYVDPIAVKKTLIYYGFIFIFNVICLIRHPVWNIKYNLYPQFACLAFTILVTMINIPFGLLNIATGLILSSSAMIGLLLFSAKIIWFNIIVALIIQFTLVWIGDFIDQWIPFLWVSNIESASSATIFYTASIFFMMLPYLFFLVLTAFYLIYSWQNRERETKDLSETDFLLGIKNRYAILNSLQSWLNKQAVSQRDTSVILFDIDHFKKINDTYGHRVGDYVLLEVVKCVGNILPKHAEIGRYGGEEFLCLFPNTDAEQIKIECIKLQNAIRALRFEARIAPLPHSITASFGVYTCRVALNLTDVLSRVDNHLYAAKDKGRDCIVGIDEEPND